MTPKIIKRGILMIAGVSGDGSKTEKVWNKFAALYDADPIENTVSDKSSYEIRFYDGDACAVHVGLAVKDELVDEAFSIITLPASEYASFDVYAVNGYDSENKAMEEWLKANQQKYKERLLEDMHYCVEYYSKRFYGNEPGSILEIWIPIEKVN